MYVFCPQIIRTSEIFKFSIEDHENDLFVYNYVYITFLNRKNYFQMTHTTLTQMGKIFFHFHHGNRKLTKWEQDAVDLTWCLERGVVAWAD